MFAYRAEYDHPSAVSRRVDTKNVKGEKVREISSWSEYEQDSKI